MRAGFTFSSSAGANMTVCVPSQRHSPLGCGVSVMGTLTGCAPMISAMRVVAGL